MTYMIVERDLRERFAGGSEIHRRERDSPEGERLAGGRGLLRRERGSPEERERERETRKEEEEVSGYVIKRYPTKFRRKRPVSYNSSEMRRSIKFYAVNEMISAKKVRGL